MAALEDLTKLDQCTKDRMACTLAVLLLHDNKSEINSESLSKVLKKANVVVAPYWPKLMAKALEGQNVEEYLTVSGGSGSAPAKDDKKAEEEEEEEEEVEEEEEEVEMGGFFDM